ncbi:hypothetical protein C8J56DRAFT_934432 [Mycena floridula]|nr:hypothetical protein C8J56DRAFT_934432 [Mycena floridula]
MQLPIETISQEIARLQDSVRRLDETQHLLQEHLASESTPDPEITQAIQENETTIGSQRERILMLKLAMRLAYGHPAPIVQEQDDSDTGIHL